MKLKKLNRLLLLVALVTARSVIGGEGPPTSSRLNRALAETPPSVSVSIARTGPAVDGGSILNELRFSDGRIYTLSLDFPFDLMTDKLVYPEIHFTIFIAGEEPSHREILEHATLAEERLIELLKARIDKTQDPHEKKNASSLVAFLRDRHQPFPRARGGQWDLTPYSLK